MTRFVPLALLVTLVSLVPLAGCSSESAGAMVACEDLIDRRVGAELQHATPMEGETVEGSGPYVVRGSYVEPVGGKRTTYVCTVERTGGGWRLVDLQSSR